MEITTWFEEDPEDGLTDDESRFLTALRTRAVTWAEDPAYSMINVVEQGKWRRLLARMDLPSDEDHILLTFGAFYQRGVVYAGELHNQWLELVGDTIPPLAKTGSADELGTAVADWFQQILERPVTRAEWIHDGHTYAKAWRFADDGRVLSQSYDQRAAPDGLEQHLIDEGHVHGKGWVQVAGIGQPDRVVTVRPTAEQTNASP